MEIHQFSVTSTVVPHMSVRYRDKRGIMKEFAEPLSKGKYVSVGGKESGKDHSVTSTEKVEHAQPESHGSAQQEERPGTSVSYTQPGKGFKDPITGEYILHMEPLSIIRNSEVGKRCLIANARAKIELSRTVRHYKVERDYQLHHWSLSQKWYRQRLDRLLVKRKDISKERMRREQREMEYIYEQQRLLADTPSRRVTFIGEPAPPKYGTPRAGDDYSRHGRARSAPPMSDYAAGSARAHYAFRPVETVAEVRSPSSAGSTRSLPSPPAGPSPPPPATPLLPATPALPAPCRSMESRSKPPPFKVVWT